MTKDKYLSITGYFVPIGGYCVYYSSDSFCNVRSCENWGIFPSFRCGVFGHMTCLDRASKNI